MGVGIGSGLVKAFRQAWIAYTTWLFWFDRNNSVFNNQRRPSEAMFKSCNSLVLEQFASCPIEAQWEELSLLMVWGLRPIITNSRAPTMTGTCFLIHYAGSPILAATAIPIDHIKVNYAELIVAWSALTWCYKRYGACLVWIAGDSKHVLDLLSKEPYHTDSPILVNCKSIISSIEEYKISHIFREVNASGDLLANMGCGTTSSILWEFEIPGTLLASVERDMRGPFVRL
ncbi:uncharacterized protein A4U43_C09F2850 [Asparagus officinalis]|uniref:RNase H type-1 domain-containing protein n=1 Tax=Asparagus officinalis TaxID=4686 RepID=A0A5P1E545_ASPOF|nr:uncharacterized protein A4U43_C09F2850 [Asparagus officinalis]